jgi:thioredoxin-related protein
VWRASRVAFLLVALIVVAHAKAQDASPNAIDIPSWFANTFLDFREDVADAARDGRRLLVYFGQDGCPYCRALMTTNFSQRAIVEKTRRHFVAIELNIWGDRETTWVDGRVMTEKALARALDVQFTPTILFLDEKGKVVARLNGYYPPPRFEPVLDYVAGRLEGKQALGEYLALHVRETASAKLADDPAFLPPPYDLRRGANARPLAVFFETTYCSACDELHREGLARKEVRAQVDRFDVVRFALGAVTPLTTPDGRATTARVWARELGIAYTPAIVFFDASGKEVFRIDAYIRPFHLATSFEYVASAGYASEPSFQRYVQARAARLAGRGESVDLWR